MDNNFNNPYGTPEQQDYSYVQYEPENNGEKKSKGLAIASMVIGIVMFVLGCCVFSVLAVMTSTFTMLVPAVISLLGVILGIMSAAIIAVMLYVRFKILSPFEKLTDIPYELSKGNLTAPVKESKNKFFGRFVWGVDMLRENMEQQKERELGLQRDKKMLLLSLSHDIKTPLSAIKLYSKALSKGLYDSKEKQLEIAESINAKADEIEGYVSQIISASREDFLSFEVHDGEFYLSELVTKIELYYTEKLSLVKTEFRVGEYGNCLIYGDSERSIEVIQNIMENAINIEGMPEHFFVNMFEL